MFNQNVHFLHYDFQLMDRSNDNGKCDRSIESSIEQYPIFFPIEKPN